MPVSESLLNKDLVCVKIIFHIIIRVGEKSPKLGWVGWAINFLRIGQIRKRPLPIIKFHSKFERTSHTQYTDKFSGQSDCSSLFFGLERLMVDSKGNVSSFAK